MSTAGIFLRPPFPLLLLRFHDGIKLRDVGRAGLHQNMKIRNLTFVEFLETWDVLGGFVVVYLVCELDVLTTRDKADVRTLTQVPLPVNLLLRILQLVGDHRHEVETELSTLASRCGLSAGVGVDASLDLLGNLRGPRCFRGRVANKNRSLLQAIELVDFTVVTDVPNEMEGIALRFVVVHDLERRLMTEGIVRPPNGLTVADGQTLHLRVQTGGEFLELFEMRTDIELLCVHVEQHGQDRLRGTRVLNDLVCKEETVVHRIHGGSVVGLLAPLEEEDQPIHLTRVDGSEGLRIQAVDLLELDVLDADLFTERGEHSWVALNGAPILRHECR
mmetsp:Transcript_43947/g.116174  ORF Transcript_43947/g.116174 Transcript_43947/m.116174 type:complete len:332 (-) Transcript_43947:50-1045(-)